MQRQRIDSSEETQPMNALFIKISKTNSSREETILKLEIVLYDGHMYGLIPKPNKVTQKKKSFKGIYVDINHIIQWNTVLWNQQKL